ncbi:hypothetical protein D3C86_1919000 [compost metagenome]
MIENLRLGAGDRVFVGNTHDFEPVMEVMLDQKRSASLAQTAVNAMLLYRQNRLAGSSDILQKIVIQRLDRVHAHDRRRDIVLAFELFGRQ